MSIRLVAAAGLSLVLLVGCATATGPDPDITESGGPSDPAGFSIERLLGEAPDLGDEALVSVADVVAAADSAGLARPEHFGDDFAAWVHDLSGTRAGTLVSVPWAMSLGVQQLVRHDEFIAAAGFGLPDVDAFLEQAAPPHSFTLLEGDFDTDAISAALGDPVDGIWAQPGEELAVDPDGSRAIDRLGRPVRIAVDAHRLALTLEREFAEAWLAGSAGVSDELLAIGRALDGEGVYAAQLVADGDGYVAVGLAFRDGGSVPVAVRVGGTPPAVGDSEGPFAVEAVESQGELHVIQLAFTDEAPPATTWQLFAHRSPLLGRAGD